MSEILRAPFGYFGNKRRIADQIWLRLGDVDSYIEPCVGSASVYFSRPNPRGIEIINDADGFLINAFRAITYAPDEVAKLAEYPASELDIIARHRWLMEVGKPKLNQLKIDPFYHDPLIAAWWIYGLNIFVGSGWCSNNGYKNQKLKIPKHTNEGLYREDLRGDPDKIETYFRLISKRMINTKICCGNWERVLTPAWIDTDGVIGIVIDPPYEDDQHTVQYSAGGKIAQSVRKWAIDNANNPKLRIVICGYESESYTFPPDLFETFEWKATGGYSTTGNGQGKDNAKRERIWFSKHCLKTSLFNLLEEDLSDNIVDVISEQTNYDPLTTLVLSDDNIKVTVVSRTSAHISPIAVLSKETEVVLPKAKQTSIKPKYSQMSIFDLMSEGEENESTA